MTPDARDLRDLARMLVGDGGDGAVTSADLVGVDRDLLAAELRAAVTGLDPVEQRRRLAQAFGALARLSATA